MPRYARIHAPGALVHVISRFVNRQFRLAGPCEREAILERIPRALGRADWQLHAYALMSSHVHLALRAGEAPPWTFLHPLHVSIALWLNRRQGALGPVFAERPTMVVMAPERMAHLVAYLHNNPVRAGLAQDAQDSDWTSHRHWTGQAAAPAWLHVAAGLRQAGYDGSARGRQAFDDEVRTRRSQGRDVTLSGQHLRALRRDSRARTGLPVELSSPVEADAGAALASMILHPGPPLARPRWEGSLALVLQQACERTGVSVAQAVSRSRHREVVRTRRLFLLAATRSLRRARHEAAGALGLSGSAASYLLRDCAQLEAGAQEIAEAAIARCPASRF